MARNPRLHRDLWHVPGNELLWLQIAGRSNVPHPFRILQYAPSDVLEGVAMYGYIHMNNTLLTSLNPCLSPSFTLVIWGLEYSRSFAVMSSHWDVD